MLNATRLAAVRLTSLNSSGNNSNNNSDASVSTAAAPDSSARHINKLLCTTAAQPSSSSTTTLLPIQHQLPVFVAHRRLCSVSSGDRDAQSSSPAATADDESGSTSSTTAGRSSSKVTFANFERTIHQKYWEQPLQQQSASGGLRKLQQHQQQKPKKPAAAAKKNRSTGAASTSSTEPEQPQPQPEPPSSPLLPLDDAQQRIEQEKLSNLSLITEVLQQVDDQPQLSPDVEVQTTSGVVPADLAAVVDWDDFPTKTDVLETLRSLNLTNVRQGPTHLTGLSCMTCGASSSVCVNMKWPVARCTACAAPPALWPDYVRELTRLRQLPDAGRALLLQAAQQHKHAMDDALAVVHNTWRCSRSIHAFANDVGSRHVWQDLKQRLGLNSVSQETFDQFKVRGNDDYSETYPAVVYPRFRNTIEDMGQELKPTSIKLIQLADGGKLRKEIRPNPVDSKAFPGLFGWHLVTTSDKTIVLTTNEKDALAIFECSNQLAVALPSADQIDYDVVPYLEEFDVVYLWYPSASIEKAREFAHIVSPSRCLVVNNKERPLELLQLGRRHRIREILKSDQNLQRAMPRQLFRSSADYREPLRQELTEHDMITRGIAQEVLRWLPTQLDGTDDWPTIDSPEPTSRLPRAILQPIRPYPMYPTHYPNYRYRYRSSSPTYMAPRLRPSHHRQPRPMLPPLRSYREPTAGAIHPSTSYPDELTVDHMYGDDSPVNRRKSLPPGRLSPGRLSPGRLSPGRLSPGRLSPSPLARSRSPVMSRRRHLNAGPNVAKFKRWDVLNRILGGFRVGEMTIFTGASGSGKTTFLCEYTIDLAKQGVRTLFCSFEMPETRILKWMACQYAQLPLYRPEYRVRLERILDRFERMEGGPIFINSDAFRDRHPADIADAIRTQVEMSRISHVVIDNLQFLVGTVSTGNFQDRFALQDEFVKFMRRMATDLKVHVTIVVHPRKDDVLTTNSIYGGSRLTQEADNVLLIQRRQERDGRYAKFIHIAKNRFNGITVNYDRLLMRFNRDTLCHSIDDTRSRSEPLTDHYHSAFNLNEI